MLQKKNKQTNPYRLMRMLQEILHFISVNYYYVIIDQHLSIVSLYFAIRMHVRCLWWPFFYFFCSRHHKWLIDYYLIGTQIAQNTFIKNINEKTLLAFQQLLTDVFESKWDFFDYAKEAPPLILCSSNVNRPTFLDQNLLTSFNTSHDTHMQKKFNRNAI